MPSSQIAPVDASTREPITHVLPKTVALTSAPFAWRGIALEQFVAPPVERPDWLLPDHTLTLHHSNPADIQVRSHGRWQTTVVRPGDLSFFPAGEARDVMHQGGFDVIFLSLQPGLVHQALGADTPQPEFVRRLATRDAQVERIALLLREDLTRGCPGGPLFRESLATALAAHLLTHYAARPAAIHKVRRGLGPSDLRRCLEFIHDQLAHDLRLSDMAACVHLSPYHFARLFKQSTGQSPHKYVLAQRVEQAKHLLRAGQSAGTVAYAVGFGDQAHFSRHFKKLTGMTPHRYRRG